MRFESGIAHTEPARPLYVIVSPIVQDDGTLRQKKIQIIVIYFTIS